MSDVRSVKRLIEVYYREIHSIEDLAQLTKYSSETLRKDFVRWEGITLSDFITKTRVEKAKERLERTDLTCREICYAVGFSREEVGERAFRRLTGKSMKEHREFSQRQISSGDPASHVTPWDGNHIPLKSTARVNRNRQPLESVNFSSQCGPSLLTFPCTLLIGFLALFHIYC